MRKILIFLISLAIICSLIFFAIKDKLNINKILTKIENDTGINIELQDKQKWVYYPKIAYKNNLSLNNKSGNLTIENSSINIARDYGISSPFIIKFQSPSIIYKGVNFRNSKIESEYKNNILNINTFNANVIDGSIDITGQLYLNNNKKIFLEGSYNNISLNRILKQLNVANWERVKIKLSSSNFKINSINDTPKKIIENLNGEMDIVGSIFFVSTEEERFGAAFLSLLADKLANMISLSESISYLLDKFADLPSYISGKILINNGVLTTEKLLIENKKEKALLSASLDLKTNIIDGKIDLYENNIIFLTVQLKGNIENPEILIGGEVFSKEGNTKPQNIKQIFEEGIQSLVDTILNLND
tara:strand:- start:3559 stop:4638 length:1080 start_codon:yes stop_codon:yes gene_type:complete